MIKQCTMTAFCHFSSSQNSQSEGERKTVRHHYFHDLFVILNKKEVIFVYRTSRSRFLVYGLAHWHTYILGTVVYSKLDNYTSHWNFNSTIWLADVAIISPVLGFLTTNPLSFTHHTFTDLYKNKGCTVTAQHLLYCGMMKIPCTVTLTSPLTADTL